MELSLTWLKRAVTQVLCFGNRHLIVEAAEELLLAETVKLPEKLCLSQFKIPLAEARRRVLRLYPNS